MNKLDEMILSELVCEGESWVGKSYDQFSFSNTYASSTIQKHLYALDKKGLIKKGNTWNGRKAAYFYEHDFIETIETHTPLKVNCRNS